MGDLKSMIKVEGQTIQNQMVILDGYHYKKCTMNRCQIVYSGMGVYSLEDCNISSDSVFGFNGPAQTMLSFLSVVYNSNQNGKALVETIFQSIRNGLQPQTVAAPQPEKKPEPVN
jgi:hypothetical protein